MTTPFDKTLALIDAAHSQDPNKITPPNSNSNDPPIPYELHYANKMTKYLKLHTPSASPALQLAVRAQHLRRWEVPRSDFPQGKAGYYAWRTYLGRRQAEIVHGLCVEGGLGEEMGARVAALVRKEGLKGSGAGEGEMGETQVLEDVACLVFLDDRLEGFSGEVEEEKMVGILRKTWAKMSGRGRELALGMELGEKGKELVKMALGG